jgi:hypothetical protein
MIHGYVGAWSAVVLNAPLLCEDHIYLACGPQVLPWLAAKQCAGVGS